MIFSAEARAISASVDIWQIVRGSAASVGPIFDAKQLAMRALFGIAELHSKMVSTMHAARLSAVQLSKCGRWEHANEQAGRPKHSI